MKTKLLLLLLLFWQGVVFGQENTPDKYLKNLSDQFTTINTSLINENKVLENIKAKITSSNNDSKVLTELTTQLDKTKVLQFKLDSIYTVAQTAISHYNTKGELKKEEAEKIFPHKHQISSNLSPESADVKTYLYFGEKKIIAEDDEIFKNKIANDVFLEILSTDSKSYLGDFSIPQEGQKITLYDSIKTKTQLNFQKVRFHILEGSVYDIQIYLTDNHNNLYLYENKKPISLLRYTTLSPINFMFFKMAISNDKNTALDVEKYNESSVKLSDVLNYIPNPGDNYVPEDLTIELPTKKDENTNQAATYKVQQNTALKNIVELRTYTDFLGLFGDAPNGIVQLEGKADFYIHPFNYHNSYFFKKVTPFVHFSRIDKDKRGLELLKVNDNTSTIKTSLDILEKSYLQMGVNLNVFSFRFVKESPFEANLYGIAKYNISDIMKQDSTFISYKSLGLGGGITLEFRRYNNFGFIYSAELTNYNTNKFNVIDGIENTNDFLTFKNEAEIYYFPNKSKNQSIFLRFKTFNNSTKNNNEAFYQLQFGYRFSIGVNKLKQ